MSRKWGAPFFFQLLPKIGYWDVVCSYMQQIAAMFRFFKKNNNTIYKSYVLHQEIKMKRSITAEQKKDFKNILREKISTFDFVRISFLFLIGNDGKLGRATNAYFKKLQSLGFN